jgi:hypothetical protein
LFAHLAHSQHTFNAAKHLLHAVQNVPVCLTVNAN